MEKSKFNIDFVIGENTHPTPHQIDRWAKLYKHLLRKRKQISQSISDRMEERNKRVYKTCSFLTSVITERCITPLEKVGIVLAGRSKRAKLMTLICRG